MIAEIARKVLIRVIISRMKYYKQVLAIESLQNTGCIGNDIRQGDLEMNVKSALTGMYTGILEEEVKLHEEKNPLQWLPLTEDFTDRDRFAGVQILRTSSTLR